MYSNRSSLSSHTSHRRASILPWHAIPPQSGLNERVNPLCLVINQPSACVGHWLKESFLWQTLSQRLLNNRSKSQRRRVMGDNAINPMAYTTIEILLFKPGCEANCWRLEAVAVTWVSMLSRRHLQGERKTGDKTISAFSLSYAPCNIIRVSAALCIVSGLCIRNSWYSYR